MALSWLKRMVKRFHTATSGRNHQRAPRRGRRLTLETLDPRIVPAVFNVNTTADVLGGSALSLRQAILNSNQTAGPNTINLTVPGTYRLTRFGDAHDGTNGALQITDHNLTINGFGPAFTKIDGGGVDRVFDVEGALNVAFNGVTIQHGLASSNSNKGSDNNGNASDGGGIYSPLANLQLTNTVVANNLAGDFGGGIWTDTGNVTILGGGVSHNIADNSGGGLYTNSGAIAAANATFADNLSDNNGGAIVINSATSPGNLTIAGCDFTGNTADDRGGAIADFSKLNKVSITGTRITDNTADSSGGGLYIAAANLTIDHSRISGNISDGNGGGIYANDNVNQDLRITNSRIDGNTADGDGGGIESNAAMATFTSDSFSHNVADDGGGIAFFGPQLTLTNCHVDGNRVESSEGGLDMSTLQNGSSCTITNSTLDHNRAASSDGGAFIRCTTLTVRDSTINGNRSGSSEGGLEASVTTATFTNVSVIANVAASSDGGLDLNATTLMMTGCTISNNRAGSSVGGIFANGSATISNTTISGNRAAGGQGGLDFVGTHLELLGDTITGNKATGSDGGVFLFAADGGGGTIRNTTISGNWATGNAGGIETNLVGGTLTITGCSISNNHAGQDGGGLFDNGGGTLNLVNDTLFGNTASVNGGGIAHESGSQMNLVNVTIDGNRAANGGGVFNPAKAVTVHNSIIAGNAANAGHGPDVNGAFTTLDFNLIGVEDATCNAFADGVNHDQVGSVGTPKVARLGRLQNNGGPTFTQALLAGSPAIDHGSNAPMLATDQRGVGRPRDGDGNGSKICDIGAFER